MKAQLTIAALLAQGIRRLEDTGDAWAHPRLEAELLLAQALKTSRALIMTSPDDVADEAGADTYRELIDRRAAGEPLAYILGSREFWSLRLNVSPAVLVPRPETELLVERALALRGTSPCRVADLGTGSGAIALALATERPNWAIVATDVSESALALARANAEALRLTRVEFRAGSWFAPLAGRRFDLVISNPPYIAADDPALQHPALRHEPRGALTPGSDALACLREIIDSAPSYLEPDGWLLLEHGSDQASAVARDLVARGFRHVRSHRDLAGHERMTEAQRGSRIPPRIET